ncbi:MAG: twin-arginine translocation signal domain-containing protein [Myxococcota bacterium]
MARKPKLNRRGFLKGATALGAGSALSMMAPRGVRPAHADDRTRFLIVLGAAGGASILDGPMAIRASESDSADTLNTFADQQVQSFEQTELRAVDLERDALGQIPMAFRSNQSDFVRKHGEQMMVATTLRTSVNHSIGQRRSVTGNEIWQGRTLQEIVANEYGQDYVLPNVHLTLGTGFTDRGTDASLPSWVFGEPIADAALWPLALDSSKGLRTSFDPKVLQHARTLRSNLERKAPFSRVFADAQRIKYWQHLRGGPREALEAKDLINKLMLFPDSPNTPLADHGLTGSASAARAREVFPDYAIDPLQAQAALAFLLLRYRIAVTVTLGPNFNPILREGVGLNGGSIPEGGLLNPPIAFDFSHQGHRSVQALMWQRMYSIADGLIELLRDEEYADGESFWDRSMIYIATDFGRSKTRPARSNEFATGHDLNNGVTFISPLVRGGKVLGGVDPNTGMTYGFDPTTGAADPGRTMEESEIFAGIVHALGVDTSGTGLPDMRAMRKLA